MSRIQYFFLSVLMAISLIACNTDSTENDRAIANKIRSYESFAIDSVYAKNCIKEYKRFIDDVSNELSQNSAHKFPNHEAKLNYGVAVNINELKEILLRSDSLSELFVMNAVMTKQPSDSTEVIFALKSISKIGNNHEETWQFFDFTKPCPTYCPSIPGVSFD